jgi:hypothetical protein
MTQSDSLQEVRSQSRDSVIGSDNGNSRNQATVESGPNDETKFER